MPLILPFRRVLGTATPLPGSVSYTTVGTFTFIVPRHRFLVVDVRGAGGGGGGGAYYYDETGSAQGGTGGGINVVGTGRYQGYIYFLGGDGGGGGFSRFRRIDGAYQVLGFGGSGGPGGSTYQGATLQPQGAHGTATGGDTNTTGGGAAEGTYGYTSGYSAWFGASAGYGGYGGRGGRAYKTFTPGQLPIGTSIEVVVGAGGSPGYQYTTTYPTYGANGAVYISWS